MIALGVDAVCWHARLAAGEIALEHVLEEVAELGAAFLQTSLSYVGDHRAAVDAASGLGVALRASGGPLGRRYHQHDAARATAVLRGWLEEARTLGSPTLFVHSGVYRPEIAGDAAATAAELTHLGAVLDGAVETAEQLGVTILMENASDFSADELSSLLDGRPAAAVGVFLDLLNPYNVWENPLETIAKLAPHAPAGHAKDFALESIWNADGFHRHGYSVLFRYPGEGVVDQRPLIAALAEARGAHDFELSIEGLDSHAGVDDQVARLRPAMTLLRGLVEAARERAR